MSSAASSYTPTSAKRTLQRLRREAGYRNAKDFAAVLGIPASTYSRYERAEEGPLCGIPLSSAWSIADETLHTESMTKLFREYIVENPELWNDSLKAKIYGIAETMVELEDRFIDLAFGVSEMRRLTREEVRSYIRYIADRRLIGLGMKGIFGIKKNPLPWVDAMLGVSHTNFFENKVVDYAKGALTGDWGDVWGVAKG